MEEEAKVRKKEERKKRTGLRKHGGWAVNLYTAYPDECLASPIAERAF